MWTMEVVPRFQEVSWQEGLVLLECIDKDIHAISSEPREALRGTGAEHIPQEDIYSSASGFGHPCHPNSTIPELSEMKVKGTKSGPHHATSCWH